MFSALLIVLFSPLIGSLDESYRSFAEPASIPQGIESTSRAGVSVFVAVLGLIFTSTMIALISQFYDDLITQIRHGKFRYKGYNHIIIIGLSEKVWTALEAMNQRYQRYNEIKDVLFLLSDTASERDVDLIYSKRYSHLQLFARVDGALLFDQVNAANAGQIISFVDSYRNQSDAKQIKIATALALLFKIHPSASHPQVLLEVSNKTITSNIISAICKRNGCHTIAVCDTQTLFYKMAGTALLDTQHLKLINHLNSYIDNGIYVFPASRWITAETTFLTLVGSFSGAVLIGVQFAVGGHKLLCEGLQRVEVNDDLIFMAKSPDSINFELGSAVTILESCSLINIESISDSLDEKHQREILVCGDNSICEALKDTLDEDSLNGADTITSSSLETMSAELFDTAKLNDYDAILINVSEDRSLSFSLYMGLVHSDAGVESGMASKAIAIVDNTDKSLEIIKASMDDYHVMNPDDLIGRHLGQVCFDHRLDKIYLGLVSAEGADLYFIPQSLCNNIRTNVELKATLLMTGIIVVGYTLADGGVVLGVDDLEEIKSNAIDLIGLSSGKL
jgi:hypothetical protein